MIGARGNANFRPTCSADEQARAVHVDVRGIVESLDRVYKAADLLKELGAAPGATAQSDPRL